MLYFQITKPWNQRPLAAYPQRNSNSQPGHGSAPHQRSASVRVVKLLYHLTVTDGFQRGWSWWSWKKGKTSPGLFSYYNTYGVYDKIHISVKNENKLYGNLVSGKGFSISKFQCIKAEDSDNTNIRQLGSLCVGHGRSKIWCWKIWLKDSRLQHFVPEESFEAAASAQDNSNTMETRELHVCLVCLGRFNLLSFLFCWQKIIFLFPWFWCNASKGIALHFGAETLPRRCKESTLACAHWYFWPQN